MADTQIKIRRSTTTATPTTIAVGELLFSGNLGSNSLFIGDPAAADTPIRIAGGKYAFLHQSGLPGVLTVNSVPVVNNSGYMDEWKTNKLWVGTANVTSVNAVANATHLGLASNTELPTSWAVKTYVDTKVAATDLEGLTDVDLTTPSGGQVMVYDETDSQWKNRTISGTATKVTVTSTNTGIAVTLPSDVAITANLTVGNGLVVTGLANVAGRLTSAGNVNFANTLSVVGAVVLSNTLNVTGTGQFDGDLTVSGNLTVLGGLTTVDTTNLVVEDPLIKLALNNTSGDAVDIGLYGVYDSGGTDMYTGLFRDASDGKYRLFKSLEAEPTTTVNVSGTGFALATLVASFEGSLTSSAVTITGGSITGITDLATADGGTGLSSFTSGGVFYASNTSHISFASSATEGHVLQVVSGVPTFGMLDGGTF